jgi:hypothetical protein
MVPEMQRSISGRPHLRACREASAFDVTFSPRLRSDGRLDHTCLAIYTLDPID